MIGLEPTGSNRSLQPQMKFNACKPVSIFSSRLWILFLRITIYVPNTARR